MLSIDHPRTQAPWGNFSPARVPCASGALAAAHARDVVANGTAWKSIQIAKPRPSRPSSMPIVAP